MPIRLIVGLGNPGPDYEGTRHNVGFWFVEELARRESAFFREEKKFNAEVARIRLADQDVWLAKPQTYMNRSGSAVVAIALYYKILPEEILVVHDELDLMPGCMKIKKGGGNAGHNGLKDVSEKLSTADFWRLRIGTGHPRSLGLSQQVADFVLHRPSAEHREQIQECLTAALKCATDIATGDMTRVKRALAPFSSPRTPKTEDSDKDNA